MHNIRPAEAFNLAREALNFVYFLVYLKKHSLNVLQPINFGPWISKKIFWPAVKFKLCTTVLKRVNNGVSAITTIQVSQCFICNLKT
jgi:hypothetical protein